MATSPSTRNPPDIKENLGLYWLLLFVGVLIVMALLISATLTWSVRLLDVGITFDNGPTTLLIVMIYIALSIVEVRTDEIAGAYCYGRALKKLVQGPHFVPFGLMQIKKAPRTVQEFQCPGEPENVFKGDDRDTLPEGKVRPIRAVTAASKGEDDILDVRMTLDLNFVVQYVIDDIFDYKANFGTTEQIERQLRDIGEATLAERVTKETPSSFIAALPEVNESLINATRARFENTGVHILSVRLISPDVSHGVSSALADIPVARAKAEQAKVTAEGEKVKRTKEGEGTAAAALSMLEAQAKGRKSMMDTLAVAGETVLASEAAMSLAQKTVVVVGAEGGMRDMMGLVKGAQASLKQGGTEP